MQGCTSVRWGWILKRLTYINLRLKFDPGFTDKPKPLICKILVLGALLTTTLSLLNQIVFRKDSLKNKLIFQSGYFCNFKLAETKMSKPLGLGFKILTLNVSWPNASIFQMLGTHKLIEKNSKNYMFWDRNKKWSWIDILNVKSTIFWKKMKLKWIHTINSNSYKYKFHRQAIFDYTAIDTRYKRILFGYFRILWIEILRWNRLQIEYIYLCENRKI